MHCETGPGRAAIHNHLVEVEATTHDGVLALTVCARLAGGAGGGRVPVLTRVGANKNIEPLQAEVPERAALEVHELSDSTILVVRGFIANAEFSLNLRLYDGSPWIEVAELYACEGGPTHPQVDWFEAVWRLVDWQEPGEVFSPVLVPEPGDVVGRHVMRAPALVAQCRGRTAALVNDVDSVGRAQALPACMNLLRDTAGAPVFRTGLRPHKVRGHVFFEYAPDPQRPERLHHAYQLYIAAEAPEGAAMDHAAQRLWQGWGRRHHRAATPPPMRYEDYARQIYPRVLERLWAETRIDGQRVGAITINRSYPRDVWMCPWFSQARSAYGMYLWGKWLGESDWMERAIATRDLHLAAPQEGGLFPTVFVFAPAPGDSGSDNSGGGGGGDSGGGRWVHSHHQGGGPGIYHLFDMSWTVYQLLRWHRDILPDPRTLALARAYARGVLGLQAGDGSFPAYIDAKTLAPVTKVDRAALLADLKTSAGSAGWGAGEGGGNGYVQWGVEKGWVAERFVKSAEDAGTLLCLAALAQLLPADDPGRPRFLAGARASADWLARAVYPTAGWTDFEVYYSCSSKPLDFHDGRSGQGPQNTLCMHMAAAGMLVLYELLKEERYLDLARRALSRMSLYQQIWDPPFLNFNGFGGYGVMNTDGEWSDARQGQFADTHLDFHSALGDAAQLERAQAACRAGFATVFLPGSSAWYPTGWNRQPQGQAAENHAHSGHDHLCGVSSFDWGSGSALATAAYLRLRGVLPNEARP